MARFQAKTNAVLETQLESLQYEFGLRSNQKADLLRELTTIAAWVVRQAIEGRSVVAHGIDDVRELHHPMIEKVRQRSTQTPVQLSCTETQQLAVILDRGFCPTPALSETLRNLSASARRAPELTWSIEQ